MSDRHPSRDDPPDQGPPRSLEELVDRELRGGANRTLAASTATDISVLAEAARERHGAAVAAVLFYGSCLREESLEDRVADLYVLVKDYRRAFQNPLSALANWLLPPNVYYLEQEHEGRILRAKYAVLSLADLRRATDGTWLHSYVWARFAQPCHLVWADDPTGEDRVVSAIAASIRTLIAETRPLLAGDAPAELLWTRAFLETYRSELRAESGHRPQLLVAHDLPRYRQATALAEAAGPPVRRSRAQAARRWAGRRIAGKILSALRLMKAAFTFSDGATYILWKIERHSGVTLELTPWEKRHPILASSWLFWRLYKKGAFR